MKLKFAYTPKKDANGFHLRLPNGTEKRFKTQKSFDRWFVFASNELNSVFKTYLILYPELSQFYSELFLRSNIYNANRLAFIQRTFNDVVIVSKIFGIIPNRGFYEAYSDMYKLLSFYNALLDVYFEEFTIFSDRYVLNRILMIRQLLTLQKFNLDKL